MPGHPPSKGAGYHNFLNILSIKILSNFCVMKKAKPSQEVQSPNKFIIFSSSFYCYTNLFHKYFKKKKTIFFFFFFFLDLPTIKF